MQNFNSISLKLCLLGQKTGTWGVNTTIAAKGMGILHIISKIQIFQASGPVTWSTSKKFVEPPPP